MKFNLTLALAFVALSTGNMLSGCAPSTQRIMGDHDLNNPKIRRMPPPSFAQYKGLPIPANAEMDLSKNLILGSGENWMGRVYLTSYHSMEDIINFYLSEMPKLGWRELTTHRRVGTEMIFERSPRIAKIELIGRDSNKTTIIITISPSSHYG